MCNKHTIGSLVVIEFCVHDIIVEIQIMVISDKVCLGMQV
jgi:hypothetical protein